MNIGPLIGFSVYLIWGLYRLLQGSTPPLSLRHHHPLQKLLAGAEPKFSSCNLKPPGLLHTPKPRSPKGSKGLGFRVMEPPKMTPIIRDIGETRDCWEVPLFGIV